MTMIPHADIVGSLLRPAELISARERFASGQLTGAGFEQIENRAVDQAIAIQQESGLDVITDGEMRRLSFQSQIPASLDGFGDYGIDAFLWGDWHGDQVIGDLQLVRPDSLGVVAKLRRRAYLATKEFVYLRQHSSKLPKVTIPSPSLFANFWSQSISLPAYPRIEGFLADVTSMLRDDVQSLIANGANYIQLDAPHYPLILDPKWASFYESLGWRARNWVEFGVDLDNALMEGFDEATFAIHLCRGNQGSRWLTEGGYERMLVPVLQRTNADRLMLEYDDHRSGTFEVLKGIPQDKTVVLGLVTTKRSWNEPVEDLVSRVEMASRYFPIDQLAVSPQCGFATSIGGNYLSQDDQRKKLRSVVEIAKKVWG